MSNEKEHHTASRVKPKLRTLIDSTQGALSCVRRTAVDAQLCV